MNKIDLKMLTINLPSEVNGLTFYLNKERILLAFQSFKFVNQERNQMNRYADL
jgi:hypothetical protein